MRIAEVSSPDVRSSRHDEPHTNILSRVETLIKELESHSSENPLPETICSNLQLAVIQLSPLAPFPNSFKLQIWKLSYRLWNACVDLSNASASLKLHEEHAKLRQVSADFLLLAGDVAGIPSPLFKTAAFFYKVGLLWHDLKIFSLASNCFEKATDLTSKVDIISVSDNEERKLLLDLNLGRSQTAWEASDRNLAITLLNRSKSILFGMADNYKTLANQYLTYGKDLLSKNEASGVNEALKLMNEALELSEKGLRMVKRAEETLALKELRSKTLRFIAASHLQRDEFESVLKCVKVLRDGGSNDHHPSLSVLAMKAWLGLGRYEEAEKELRGMVVNKGIPEGVWVSAVESYFQGAGAAGAETVKGVVFGLLERCQVSAVSAIRVVNRVIGEGSGNGEGMKVRAKVVGELVSDERVVKLFNGDNSSKERSAIHALLWNSGAENFRSKDYQISAELFEKSMLYAPQDIENRILRAKGFRVLCLCYLALSQLDRAQEYINEAEKLEPNIACAFLKFKIYLQQNEENKAVNQIQAMLNCLDFMPDFLSLAAHESIACNTLPVAISALSNLLNYYSLGKPMPNTEVSLFRTLITILTQKPGYDIDILKHMKRAYSRLLELGPDRFFGKGEIGKREWNWFAGNTWNLGIRTGKCMNYEICTEFFKLASDFYSVEVDGELNKNNIMVCKSLILSVSSILAHERKTKCPISETEVKHAIDLLERAGKVILVNTQKNEAEPDYLFIYTWSAYDLYGRFNEMSNKQLVLVKNYASSKCCDMKLLLKIGLEASQGVHANPEVAIFALNTCLSVLLGSTLPDYDDVALIMRKLICVKSVYKCDEDEDMMICMYKQGYGIMVGLKEGEYPIQEGKWLAMTAWNRAAIPLRLGNIDLGKKWMDIGFEIANKVPGMVTYKSCMEDFIATLKRKECNV